MNWDRCVSVNASEPAVEDRGKVLPAADELQGQAPPGEEGSARHPGRDQRGLRRDFKGNHLPSHLEKLLSMRHSTAARYGCTGEANAVPCLRLLGGVRNTFPSLTDFTLEGLSSVVIRINSISSHCPRAGDQAF